MEKSHGSNKVVGVGLSTIDILARLSDMPTWEAGGLLEDICIDGGGPVGTGLTAVSRLGVAAGFIGTCGSGEVADLKLRLLSRDGVDISRVVRRSRPEPQMVLVFVHAVSGERVFAFDLRPEELDREFITSADFLLLDGYHIDAAHKAAEFMHAVGKKVILDAGKTDVAVEETMRNLVAVTDILICGSGFCQALTGDKQLAQAAAAILTFGPQIVVQTEAEQGSYTFTPTECFHTPAFKVDVVDTTGAGDVFHGGYLVGLVKGFDLRRTALFASAVAAIKCTRMGGRCGIPNYTDVQSFLQQQGVQL
jgi:sulfofructose kinase